MNLTDLLNKTEKARRDAEKLETQLAKANQEADAERRRRETEARQAFLDAYDPTALNQAITDTHAALYTTRATRSRH